MDKKLVLKEFYDKVEVCLAGQNFKLNRTKSLAKRKSKFGFDSLFFDVNDMIDDITYELKKYKRALKRICGLTFCQFILNF